MMLENQKPNAPLPDWLILPLALGLLLTILGLTMPWIYPQKTLWTEADAQKHSELATQAHAAHHAAANSKTKNLHTVKEDAAKARYYREQYDLSAEKLRQVREGGSRYGQWLMIAGGSLIAIGVIASMMLRRE